MEPTEGMMFVLEETASFPGAVDEYNRTTMNNFPDAFTAPATGALEEPCSQPLTGTTAFNEGAMLNLVEPATASFAVAVEPSIDKSSMAEVETPVYQPIPSNSDADSSSNAMERELQPGTGSQAAKRSRNNEASRKCRAKRKKLQIESESEIRRLEEVQKKLQEKVAELEKEKRILIMRVKERMR